MGWLRKAVYPALSPDGPLPYPHWRTSPRLRIRILPKVLQRCKFLRDNKSTGMVMIRFRFRIDQQSSTRSPSTRLDRSSVRPDHGHCSGIFKYPLFCLLSIHSSPPIYFTWNQQNTGHMYSSFNGSWSQTTGQEGGKKGSQKSYKRPCYRRLKPP